MSNKHLTRIVLLGIVVVSMLLATTSTVWAYQSYSSAKDNIPAQPACPCYGFGCTVTVETCGWCHSNWCPGGYGVLYNGYIEYKYNSQCALTDTKYGCRYTPCGLGQCQ